MMIVTRITLRWCFSSLNSLQRFLQPVSLKVVEAASMPSLELRPHQELLRNWWSLSPFDLDTTKPMTVPLFSFTDAGYLQKQVELPQDIFNQPLRRDLIYRLYHYRVNLDKFTTKKTRNRAQTHGSGKKMHAQKGQGIARQGDRRAPHLYKGGKAHGAKPKVYSFPLNAKIKLNALKALLSAKMAQGKIKLVDEETIAEGKTKIVNQVHRKHMSDERGVLCIITGQQSCPNFVRAQKNHPKVTWHDTYSLDVMSLFKADKILITQKGLHQLIENIYKTTYVIYRLPHMPKLQTAPQTPQTPQQQIDPQQPYQFKFKILAQYMDLYQKAKLQKPQLLELEKKRIRKVEL